MQHKCSECVAFDVIGGRDGDWGWCKRTEEGELYSDLSPLAQDNEKIMVSPVFCCILWESKDGVR